MPIRIIEHGEKKFGVEGTPTDCVLVAINHIMANHKPNLVLSGVNYGKNVGEDMTYSGTIAAAMEATLLGFPAIAFSLQVDPPKPMWDTAQHWAPEVIKKLVTFQWPNDVLMNVNFPAVKPDEVSGIFAVPHGIRKMGDDLHERVDPRGRKYYWIGLARSEMDLPYDTDISTLHRKGIAVTPLSLDLTHYETLSPLKKAFGK